MDLIIYPQHLKGIVEAPPSKSYTHRAIICASLACGRSVIHNPLICNDTHATINALKAIGVNIVYYETRIEIDGLNEIHIPKKPIFCHESASTMRMLIPFFSTLHHEWTFLGSEYLIKRLQDDDLHELKGLSFEKQNKELRFRGQLNQSEYLLSGHNTSQFISGMIMALPFLTPSTKLKSQAIDINNPYVQLTMVTCQHFGLEFLFPDSSSLILKTGSHYQKREFTVEGDFSNSACWLAAAYFNPQLRVSGLNPLSRQGDARFFKFLEKMKVKYRYEDGDYFYLNGKIASAEIDISETPDLAPILAAVAALGTRTVIISGIDKLQYKESNRALAIMEGLNRLGGSVEIIDNRMVIHGKALLDGGCEVDSYNDHRMVMAFAILGNQVRSPLIIKNFAAVNKSYPNFFNVFQQIGGKTEVV
ncbi:MAG TPA: 3-phosphoshikimate 1-carboxyvinyltransferase [Bacilli bacterium]|nr:3-phosphoshikimate 1-carboxyvinyltransferase [Bacilli bacterium]